MRRIGTIGVLGLALALGACKGGEKEQGAGNAQGQILPGSASDGMVPVDTVRSQAPLAPRAASNDAGAADAAATDAAADDQPADAPAAPDKPAPAQ
jgi:hypothetical protein